GDTTTTLAASLAAFYRRLQVGHVEAGLRSGSMLAPWPEELNRRVASLVTRYHFAPTEGACQNLLDEKVNSKHIFLTGNTVIDALLEVSARIDSYSSVEHPFLKQFAFIEPDKR